MVGLVFEEGRELEDSSQLPSLESVLRTALRW
jgi:hypothetical protein